MEIKYLTVADKQNLQRAVKDKMKSKATQVEVATFNKQQSSQTPIHVKYDQKTQC